MNSINSKTSDIHELLLNLADKINLKSDKYTFSWQHAQNLKLFEYKLQHFSNDAFQYPYQLF